MSLFIKTFEQKPVQNNNYVIVDEDAKEAVLIDCSWPDDTIMDWIQQEGLTLKYILLTHGHFDHVLGVNYYAKKYHIDAHLYEKDKSLLQDAIRYARHFNLPDAVPVQVKTFDAAAKFTLGTHEIKVILTPGHTHGCVCYLIGNNLFSGDTLFHGTYGRTDLPESDESKMQESLAKLFKEFPDETAVYPGHGAATTIAHERWLY